MKSELKRRSFIEKIGLSFLGLSLISLNPMKIFAKVKNENKIKVKANPYAVKRVKNSSRLK